MNNSYLPTSELSGALQSFVITRLSLKCGELEHLYLEYKTDFVKWSYWKHYQYIWMFSHTLLTSFAALDQMLILLVLYYGCSWYLGGIRYIWNRKDAQSRINMFRNIHMFMYYKTYLDGYTCIAVLNEVLMWWTTNFVIYTKDLEF